MKQIADTKYQDIKNALLELNLIAPITKKELKSSYKQLSKKYHPDLDGDRKKFELIKESYTLLSNYIENYRYHLTEEEIDKQDTQLKHNKQFGYF